MARGNKAHRDAFISIEAEVKQMLRYIHPAIQQMPKIERIDGAGAEMKRAAYAILRHFHIAYFCKESRIEHINEMIGWYGHLQAALELCCVQGILRDEYKLPIAERMERIEEGVTKWRNSQSAQRQEHGQRNGDSGHSGGCVGDEE